MSGLHSPRRPQTTVDLCPPLRHGLLCRVDDAHERLGGLRGLPRLLGIGLGRLSFSLDGLDAPSHRRDRAAAAGQTAYPWLLVSGWKADAERRAERHLLHEIHDLLAGNVEHYRIAAAPRRRTPGARPV